MVKYKKSQFKIQQMSFMLLAIVLFFILVALFYLAIQYRNLQNLAGQQEEEKSFAISQFIADSAEFNCGYESYCVDSDKIMVLMSHSLYKEFWPVAYIRLRKLGDDSGEIVCTKANYPDCNVFNVYENSKIEYNGTGIGSFIALCRHEKVDDYPARICELGKIIIGYEAK